MSEAENFELNYLIYLKPMERFQNRIDMMKFLSLGDGTGSRVEKKLKTIDLSSRKIEEQRVAIINFGMNERCSEKTSDSRSCSAIHFANTP